MRPIEALYDKGVLKPIAPLALQDGERVGLIVVRRPDPKRWNLERLAETDGVGDLQLAEQGLDYWTDALDAEDQD